MFVWLPPSGAASAHPDVTENQYVRVVHRGTKGSNPLSSSGESGANSISWIMVADAPRSPVGQRGSPGASPGRAHPTRSPPGGADRGTAGSNPASSTGKSANHP